MPPKKTGDVDGSSAMSAFVQTYSLPNLDDPKTAIGQTIEVPGDYWEGASAEERSQKFPCKIIA
jgi:hypothetical protein